MVVIEVDGIRGEGETEKQAKSALRKAQRERKEAEGKIVELQTKARNDANAQAVRIFTWFHRNYLPDSVSAGEPGKVACAEALTDADGFEIVRLHGAYGRFDWKQRHYKIMRVADCASGVFAFCAFDLRNDTTYFYAFGCCGEEISLVELPEPVGQWLLYNEKFV